MKKLIAIFILSYSLFATEPIINGFFIQPSLSYGGIDNDSSTFATQDHFDRWVKSMADVGAEMLFYQWTAHYWGNQGWYSNTYNTPKNAAYAYYDITDTTIDGISTQSWVGPTSWPGADVPAIDKALIACEKSGVKLWLGLYLNEDSDSYNWWNAVSNSTITSEDSAIIQHHIDMNKFMVNDLYAKYGDNPAFGGFYYPIEVANLCFYPKDNWDEIAWVLDEVADEVHKNDPNVKLAISPFFNTSGSLGGNGLSTAKEYGDMWNYALANSDLDILILQDGVGVEPNALTDSTDFITPYFEAAKAACDSNGVQFWANSELFRNKGERLSPKFIPSNIEKIKRQLNTENRLAKKSVCFSFHYMDPNPLHTFSAGTYAGDSINGPVERLRLYNEYKGYVDSLSNVNIIEERRFSSPVKLSGVVTEKSLSFLGAENRTVKFKLYNTFGREVVSGEVRGSRSISLKMLSSGIYFYKADIGEQVVNNYFVVQ